MSAFREQVLRDMSDEFLDPDVFGELHRVDGEPMYCVVDEDVREPDGEGAPYGVYDDTCVLYCRLSDLPRGHPGDQLEVDGALHTAIDWRVDMGMNRIVLSAPVAR